MKDPDAESGNTGIESRPLEVVYMRGSTPGGNAALTFTIVDGDASKVQLAAMSTTTGADGKGTMIVSAKSSVGQVRIEVGVMGEPNVAPIYFDVAVTPKGIMPLNVLLQYYGARNIEAVDVLLFRQTTAQPNNCADLIHDSLPTANQSQSQVKPLPYSVNFSTFPNLEADTPQYYTVVAVGHEQNGPNLAWACQDGATDKEVVKIAYGLSNQMTLVLEDIPPQLVGSYEMENYFDILSPIPDNIEGPINAVLNLFEDPAGAILQIACMIPGDALTSICEQVFLDPTDPQIDELTPLAAGITDIIDSLVSSLIEDNLGKDIFQVGQDVRLLLKELNLESTIELLAEPDADGMIPEAYTKETWHTLNYRWTYGKNCEFGDDTCGWVSYSLYAVGDLDPEVLTGSFNAKVNNYETIEIEPHPVNIKYGMLLNFLLEQVIIPLILDDSNVTSWEDFLGTLVGGSGCAIEGTCCSNLADSVDSSLESLVESMCGLLLSQGGSYIRTLLNDLDAGSGESFTLSTKNPCAILDTKNDQKIDHIGTKAEMCVWDATFNFGGDPVTAEADFWGERAE